MRSEMDIFDADCHGLIESFLLRFVLVLDVFESAGSRGSNLNGFKVAIVVIVLNLTKLLG